MTWISYQNTKAVIIKLKDDLSKLLFVGDLLVNVLFLGYYVYLSLTNLGKTISHIVYGVFILLALFSLLFVIYAKIKNIDRRNKRVVNDIVAYSKYPLRLALIVFSIVEIVQFNGSKTNIILVIASSLLLLLQIIFHLIIHFIDLYIDLFSESLKMDYEESDLIQAVVNSRNNEKKYEVSGLAKIASNLILNKVTTFIEENKDSDLPKEELSPKQEKLRSKIKKIQENKEQE